MIIVGRVLVVLILGQRLVSVANTFLFAPFVKAETTRCNTEGESISVFRATNGTLKDSPCVSCICEKGIVICKQQQCPSMQTCPVIDASSITDGCCPRCRQCGYLDERHYNDEQWRSSQDSCRTLSCKAGVITIARMQCVSECAHPLRLIGYCCPLCPTTTTTATGVVDPCVQCESTMWAGATVQHCYRTACPALDCPLVHQYRPQDRCCSECATSRVPTGDAMMLDGHTGACIFQSIRYDNQQSFRPDDCTMCQCEDGSIMCKRFVCPPIDCPAQRLYYRPTLCCPFCRHRDPLSCTYTINAVKRVYKHASTWMPDLCTNCTCANGETKCQSERCEHRYGRCPRGHRKNIAKSAGRCCPICEEREATCTVFGDPHYQTFDGFAYTFQGSCSYILTQECALRGDKPRFVVVAHNGPWGKAAWTKHITIRLHMTNNNHNDHLNDDEHLDEQHPMPTTRGSTFRISLLPGKLIKEQNETVKLPHIRPTDNPAYTAVLDEHKNVVVTVSTLGLRVLWDGHSYVEVTLGRQHQNHVCGLCGNYNGVSNDELLPQFGSELTDDIDEFAQSWKWGSMNKCEAERDRIYHRRRRLLRRHYRKNGSVDYRQLFVDRFGADDGMIYTDRQWLATLRGANNKPTTAINLHNHYLQIDTDHRRFVDDSTIRIAPMHTDDDDRTINNIHPKRKEKKKRGRKGGDSRRRRVIDWCGGRTKYRNRRAIIRQCRLLKSPMFAQCRSVVRVGHYWSSCVQDVCACPTSGRCYCESLLAFVRACERVISVNLTGIDEWRNRSHCFDDDNDGEIGCASIRGAIFTTCACPRTCPTTTITDTKWTNDNCDIRRCAPGCQCPDGMVIQDSRCIALADCPGVS